MLIRGTTPTVTFTFSTVNTADIAVAYLTVKQFGRTVIERSIDTATVESGSLMWKLTQEETLKLNRNQTADILCDWKLNDGTRGRSNIASETVDTSGKEEVI